MRRKPRTTVPVRKAWPFFFETCVRCGDDFKREPGWRFSYNYKFPYPGSADRLICCKCADTEMQAEVIATTWVQKFMKAIAG